MLDWRGQLAEGTGANIFLVINGELHTPDAGLLPQRPDPAGGHRVRAARGIKVVERAIMPNELGKADEVFLTGSAGRQKGRGQRGVTCSLPNPDNFRFSKRSPGNHGLRFCDGKMGRNSG
jgi:branched-chain amino acid aminotransferase